MLIAWSVGYFRVRLLGGSAAAGALCVVAMALVAGPFYAVRFWLVCWVLLPIIWLLLTRRAEGSGLWLVPLLTALWVNLDPQSLFAPAFVGIALLGALVDRLSRADCSGMRVPVRLGVCCLLTMVAVVAQPAGRDMLRVALGHPSSQFTWQRITEWRSPDFHQLSLAPFALCLGLSMLVLGQARGWQDRLLVIALSLMGLYGARHVNLYAILAIPVLVAAAERAPRGSRPSQPKLAPLIERGRRIRGFFAAGPRARLTSVIVTLAVLPAALPLATPASLSASERTQAPALAVQFLRQNPGPGELFNEYEWGGYLMFHLPGRLVFIDPRAVPDPYPEPVVADWYRAATAEEGWRAILARYRVGTVILSPRWPLNRALEQQPEWRQAYRDQLAVVWFKSA